MSTIVTLLFIAILAWVVVLNIPAPFKYKIGDCIGIEGQVIAQVTDRKAHKYWLERETDVKEVHLKPMVVSQESIEASTELVTCPERTWRKP